MSQSNKYLRLLKNTGIVFVGNAGSRLLIFLLLPFYTKYLSPDEYGISDLIATYAMILVGIVTCQINDSIFVFPKGEPKEKQVRFFSAGLLFLCFTFTVCAVIFGLLYALLPSQMFFRRQIWMIFGYVLLSGLQNYFQQFCRSIDAMVVYALSGLGYTVGAVVSALLILPVMPSGTTMVFTQYIGFLTGILVSIVGAKLWRFVSWPSGAVFLPDLKMLLLFAIPLVPNSIMWWMISSLNRPMLEEFVSLAAVGVYAVGCRIASLIQNFWSIVGNAWQISALEEYGRPGFAVFFNSFLDFLLQMLAMLVIALTVAAPYVMKFFVAPEFYEAYKLIPLISFGMIFTLGAGAVGTIFTAAKATKCFLYSALYALFFCIVLNLLLIPTMGVIGAALANMLTLLVEFLVRVFYAKKFVLFQAVFSKILLIVLPGTCVLLFYLSEGSIFYFVLNGCMFLSLTGRLIRTAIPLIRSSNLFSKKEKPHDYR